MTKLEQAYLLALAAQTATPRHPRGVVRGALSRAALDLFLRFARWRLNASYKAEARTIAATGTFSPSSPTRRFATPCARGEAHGGDGCPQSQPPAVDQPISDDDRFSDDVCSCAECAR